MPGILNDYLGVKILFKNRILTAQSYVLQKITVSGIENGTIVNTEINGSTEKV